MNLSQSERLFVIPSNAVGQGEKHDARSSRKNRMLNTLLPTTIDNTYRGRSLGLWLLWIVIVVKVVQIMSVMMLACLAFSSSLVHRQREASNVL
jgi:hypothetical protein